VSLTASFSPSPQEQPDFEKTTVKTSFTLSLFSSSSSPSPSLSLGPANSIAMSAANLHTHQYESPSHRYAVDKIAELERLLPPGPLSPEDRQDRSNRIYHLLLQNCRTIVRRSDRLRLMFNDIISSVEAKQKNNKYTAILRQWEQEFYERIEVEGSLGWNYLHEANFELIVQELERCCNNRYHIVRSVSFSSCGTRADSTLKGRIDLYFVRTIPSHQLLLHCFVNLEGYPLRTQQQSGSLVASRFGP